MPTESERAEESISAQDILKRLSQRTGTANENRSPGRVNVERNPSTYDSQLTNERFMNQNVNRESGIRTTADSINPQEQSMHHIVEDHHLIPQPTPT